MSDLKEGENTKVCVFYRYGTLPTHICECESVEIHTFDFMHCEMCQNTIQNQCTLHHVKITMIM